MELDEIRKLVKLVEDSGIEELEISNQDTTIRIQKSRAVSGMVPGAMMMAPSSVAPVAVPDLVAAPVAASEPERDKWMEIRSPIVGTFYRAPSPDAGAFVKVGDRITVGQTVCIIEAMKVMNEIEAEIGGVIKEILVENASPVEAEGVLFLVEPA
ncbi:MAG: acetyl-CoA carboxylase biotin carboxyl carrier protein [bacterium]